LDTPSYDFTVGSVGPEASSFAFNLALL